MWVTSDVIFFNSSTYHMLNHLNKHKYMHVYHCSTLKLCKMKLFNSLAAADAIWQPRTWSTLVKMWLGALWHQAVTWTNFDLSSIMSCSIHHMEISLEMHGSAVSLYLSWFPFVPDPTVPVCGECQGRARLLQDCEETHGFTVHQRSKTSRLPTDFAHNLHNG